MIAAWLLAAAVAAPSRAAAPSGDWLESALGAEAVAPLEKDGYLVVHRFPGRETVVQAQWTALEPLSKRASSLLQAERAIEDFRRGREVSDRREALESLLALPPGGLVTPRVRAAAALILEWLDLRPRLGKAPAGEAPMASQYWARAFVHRYNAAAAPYAPGLAEPFFLEVLDAPGQPEESREHVRAWIRARYERDVAALLERDLAAGQLSDELGGWLEKYLADNRRALRAVQLPAEFAGLFESNRIQGELADLRHVAEALSKDPSFLASLRARLAASEPAAAGAARLSGGEPHLETPGAPRPGDRVRWSAAYWVDGVAPRDRALVRETVVVDRGEGPVAVARTTSYQRENGGPYAIDFETTVPDARPFVVRWFLQAAGAAPIAHEARVEPASDVDLALDRLAEADRRLAACRLDDAATAYAALAAPAALRPAVEERRRVLARARAQLAALEREADLARADASPRGCAFSLEHGERARALLEDLPAGCSATWAPEVDELLSGAARRRRDQDTFWEAGREGRRLAGSCRADEAAKRLASGLAVLDADPAARCGDAEAEFHTIADQDLPRALAEDSIRSGVTEQLAASEPLARTDPAAALARLDPLLARVAALPSASCYARERRRGEELARSASSSLAAPAQPLAAPRDDVETVAQEVAREKDLQEAESAPRAEAEEPAPPVADEMVAPDVEAGDEPAAKPAPRRSSSR